MDLSNIRIREHYGLVTNDTKTNQFNFLITPPKNRQTIQKNSIVLIDHTMEGENCQILAEIREITSYEEVAGSTIRDRIGKLLASAKTIGCINLTNPNSPIQKLLIPPNPGSRIHMPYIEFLETALNRTPQGKPYTTPIQIGTTETTAPNQQNTTQHLNIYLDTQDITTKHTLITAVDGQGKTHTAKTITQELQNKTNHPIVILDSNNEYSNTTNINTQTTPETIAKKIKQGQTIAITAENLTQTEKTEHYTSILYTLAKSRREKTTPPFLLVIEEAQNLPPQAIQEALTPKNGIATILVTNHPTDLGAKTLNQTQIQIIGKTTDPQDLAVLTNMISSTDEHLPSLTVGEWILTGTNITYSTKIHTKQP
jgi:Cdc6-like AAA superfamily ATPase